MIPTLVFMEWTFMLFLLDQGITLHTEEGKSPELDLNTG